MWRYLVRRVLQMIPTVFGVILITFILFNIVGGSPGAMTLGRHVTPKQLEDFDEQRGFNKPLLFGWWAKTWAYEDFAFQENAGPWRQVKGVEWDQGRFIRLKDGADYAVPVAFPLLTNTPYRLSFEYRFWSGGGLRPSIGARQSPPQASVFPSIGKNDLPFTKDWKTMTVVVQGLEKEARTNVGFSVSGAPLEIRSLKLRRGVVNPFDSQLIFYLKQLARFDFGISSSLNQPVSRLLKAGIGPSLILTVPLFIFGLVLGVVTALVCAFYRNTALDRFFVVFSVALMSVNYLVWIVGGQYWLAFKWGWFPVWGFESWAYLVLPVIVGLVSGWGSDIRLYRTIVLDEMYKDYVRTAFAKGVSKPGVLFRHVLMNAMIPIVTNVVIAIPFLYTGSLLLESFFGIPGLGYLGWNAINSSDVDVIRAEVFIGSVLFVLFNLITDICYAWLDPRVKLE
jgi:peptide/nickel transport system permease protein